MQVGLLGALEVRRGGDVVPLAGGRVRTLLARLALDAGRDVSRDALIDAIWDDAPPGDAGHALQALVSRVRRALAPGDWITSGPVGYALAIDPAAVDALLFEQLAREGATALRAGNHAHALSTLREALELWRGPALGDLVGTARFARDAAARLEDLRLAATADRIEAELAVGTGSGAAGLVAELDRLVTDHPLNERLAAHRLRALAAAGRSADALEAYEQLRRRLDDELGALPSAELVAAQLAVVDGSAAAVGANGNGATAVVGASSAGAAAPSAAPEPRRTNLRFGVTSFVGRDEELARLDELLTDHRLVTLIGPGGAGKTRLAGEVAAAQADRALGGVWMAELASITDPADLAASVLGTLGMREARLVPGNTVTGTSEPTGDPVDHLVDVLAGREAVLVLDNCEHLITAAAVLADELLARCARLRIVATSREPLGIPGEHLVQVQPLGMPPEDASADDALAFAAVRLFADRAAAASPSFVVDDATSPAVVEICRRLDGQPLAIELAAARLRSMTVDQIAERLDDRFRLLTGGSRAALPRQRTLRAVVDWSWDLLTDPERILARRIAIFPAGVTLESAEAICAGGGVDRYDVADLIAALVDRSLLVLVGGAAGEHDERKGPPRYRMLETIREYGTERLDEAGELAEVRTAHARHFAAFVDEADGHLRTAQQLPWFWHLRAERENVLAALRWLIETGDARRALRLAVSLIWFWLLVGSANDSLATLRQAIAAEGEADPFDRFVAEKVIAIVDDPASSRNLHALATELLDDLVDLDHTQRPLTLIVAPMLAWLAGDMERADALFDTAEESPDPWVRAAVPLARAQWAENVGDVEQMRVHFAAALEAFRELGELWGITAALTGLGGIAALDSDLEAAAAVLGEASANLDLFDATSERSMLQLRLADVAYRRGDTDGALRHARRAREGADLASAEWAMAGAGLARLLWLVGEFDDARETLDSALAIANESDDLDRPGGGHLRAIVKGTAALVVLDDGRPDDARILLEEAYPAGLASEDQPIAALVGVGVAAYAVTLGKFTDAAEILGAAAGLRGSADPTNTDISRLTALLRRALGDEEFDARFTAAEQLDRDDAFARIDPSTL